MEYLVDQYLAEWQVYNIDPSSDNYINEANMKDAITYIIKKIMINMTEDIKFRLGVSFKMNTEEEMINSIKDVAKIAVLNYSIKRNMPVEQDDIKNINTF